LKLIFRGSNVSIFVKMLSYSHENWFFCKELAPVTDQGQQATPDIAEVSADSSDLQEGKSIEKGKDKEEKDKENATMILNY
jgi:hypothetical protein